MTATEIIQRKEEFMRVIDSTFGRLEADYTGPMVRRAFNILMRMGAFPDVPPALRQSGIKFEYASPITKAHRQVEATSLRKTVDDLAAVVQANPLVLDNFDHDRLVRDVAEANGLPQRWLKPEDEVEANRQSQQAVLAGAAAAGVGPAPGPDPGAAPDALAALIGGNRS